MPREAFVPWTSAFAISKETRAWPSVGASGWRWWWSDRCCPRERSRAALRWLCATGAEHGSPRISTRHAFSHWLASVRTLRNPGGRLGRVHWTARREGCTEAGRGALGVRHAAVRRETRLRRQGLVHGEVRAGPLRARRCRRPGALPRRRPWPPVHRRRPGVSAASPGDARRPSGRPEASCALRARQ